MVFDFYFGGRAALAFFLGLLLISNTYGQSLRTTPAVLAGDGGGFDPRSWQLRCDPSLDLLLQSAQTRESATLRERHCPSAVGALFFTDATGRFVEKNCTGTYLGEGLFLTNSHCIPLALKRDGIPVPQGVGHVLFRNQVVRPVTEVVSVADAGTSVLLRDLAMVRLGGAHLPRSIVSRRISAQGLGANELLQISRVHFRPINANNYIAGGVATVFSKSCRVAQRHLFLPQYGGPHSPVALLDDCNEIEDGNSGAPLIDVQGQLRGLLQGSHHNPLRSSLLRYVPQPWIEYYEMLQRFSRPVVWVTNLSCHLQGTVTSRQHALSGVEIIPLSHDACDAEAQEGRIRYEQLQQDFISELSTSAALTH
jgi:hypothetical protein